jgi:EAL domain-containing protein (putative c-di-GMP-specific phosphodiesterase class I)
VDELKVDKSFVTHLAHGGSDEILVRSIIELGHNLGLSVVAEGVETAATGAWLRDVGCDRLQGYLVGRPMTADAVAALLDVEGVSLKEAPVQAGSSVGDDDFEPPAGSGPRLRVVHS